jgi:hypothetical protein
MFSSTDEVQKSIIEYVKKSIEKEYIDSYNDLFFLDRADVKKWNISMQNIDTEKDEWNVSLQNINMEHIEKTGKVIITLLKNVGYFKYWNLYLCPPVNPYTFKYHTDYSCINICIRIVNPKE